MEDTKTIIENLDSLNHAAIALMGDVSRLKTLYEKPNNGSEEMKQRLKELIDCEYVMVTDAYNQFKNS